MSEVRVRVRTRPAPAPAPEEEAVPAVRVRTRPAPKAPRLMGVITTCGLCRQEPSPSGPVIGLTAKQGDQHVVFAYNGSGDISDPANYSSATRFDDHVKAGEFLWRKHNCPVERGVATATKKRGANKPAWATGRTTPVRKRAKASQHA